MTARRWAALALIAAAGCGKSQPVAPPKIVIETPKPPQTQAQTSLAQATTQPPIPTPEETPMDPPHPVVVELPTEVPQPKTPAEAGDFAFTGPAAESYRKLLQPGPLAPLTGRPLKLTRVNPEVPRSLGSSGNLFGRVLVPELPRTKSPPIPRASSMGGSTERTAGDFPGAPVDLIEQRFALTVRPVIAPDEPRQMGRLPRLSTAASPDRPSINDPSLAASQRAMANQSLPFREGSAPFEKEDLADPLELRDAMKLKGLPGDSPTLSMPAPPPYKLR